MWPMDSQGVVSYWLSIWTDHGCRDIELQRYWGHALDLLGSRDIICHVTIGIAIWVSYRWSIWTDHLSRTVFEIWSFKGIVVTTLTFWVTWRHRSCDHWIPNVWFPLGSQYELTMYLARLSRYWASKISGSRSWPFGVTDVSCHETIGFAIWGFL